MVETKGKRLWNRKVGPKYLGIHLICEFFGGKEIEDSKKLEKILYLAAKKSGNTPLKFSFQKFNPCGYSAILMLAESHIALHYWPEYQYLALDIFTCGKKKFPKKALKFLISKLKPKKIQVKEMKRGKI